MQETILVERLKQGDRDAFRWLVDHFQVKVINLSNGYLHDLHEAEDNAQEVFIEVLQSIGKFRGDSGLSTWIYRITVNKAINRRKRQQRMKLLHTLTGFSGQEIINNRQTVTAPVSQNPDFAMQNKEDRQALHQAIDRLPRQQKTAFLLNKYDRLSYKEIAAVMGTTVPAVESLLFRAKNNLRGHLSSYVQGK